ncbi:MAG: hypothetical protein KAG43_09565, partial [Candidatus Marithrix sp.]|nr:hypothetical protein [Candidatus Marithrix sp.]
MPTLKKIILVVLINIIVSPVYAVFTVDPINLSVTKVENNNYLLALDSLPTEHVISYCLEAAIEGNIFYKITLENGIQWGNELTSASLSIKNTRIVGGSVGDNMVKFLIQNVSPGTCMNLSPELSFDVPQSKLGTKFDIIATITSATIPETLLAPVEKTTLVNIVGFCANVTEIPQTECETLVKFYDDTGGDNWTDTSYNNWKLTNIPCSWDGISCVDGRVTAIERINKNLIGSLPNLSGLLELQTINLSDNKLDGPIPSIR